MNTPWSLDRHTALKDGDADTRSATVGEQLRGFGGIHGGHLAAIALRAMTDDLPFREHHPRTLTITFVAATQAGRLDVTSQTAHAGKTITVGTAHLLQDQTLRAVASALFGNGQPSLNRVDRVMPSVPGPEDCEPLGSEPVPGSDGLQIAHRPAGALPLSGSREAHALVWMRLAEDRPVDALTTVVIADGAVPALFCALEDYVAMPTLELAVHFGDLDAATDSPWLLGSFTNVAAADGWATEDGELWTPKGRLVAVTRQLRRIAAN